MQLQQLEYFIAIADAGSLNKAAEKLYMTQPSLSKAIANLEAELNIRVFERSRNGVEMTEEGRKLYVYAKAILERTELIRQLGVHGADIPETLTLATYPIITMGKWVTEFYNAHKQPYVHLRIIECRTMQAMEMVESGTAEIGFLMFNDRQKKEVQHTLKAKKLEFHPLGTDTWFANVGPCHPLYERDEVTMSELMEYACVRMPDDYFSNLTFFLEIDGIMLNQISRVIHADDTGAIMSILLHTDAFRFGPGLSASDYAAYGIRSIPIRNCDVRINVGYVSRHRQKYSAAGQDLLDLLISRTREYYSTVSA